MVSKSLGNVWYPKHFERQCPDLQLSMTLHRTVPYRIMLCCVVLRCLVFCRIVLNFIVFLWCYVVFC